MTDARGPLERHTKIALLASGGKDSLACAYLLRPLKDRLTVYHISTGDLLPEQMEIVEHLKTIYPAFVHMHSDVAGWIAEHGLPTDLFPHSAHVVGRAMGETEQKFVSRYDCCFHNLMLPIYQRVKNDGNTLMIRGTKRVDMNRLPAKSGDAPDGIEIYLPLEDWTNEDVFAYLQREGAPISRVYSHVTNSPECMRCSAWWNERRAAYLRQYHPAAFADYAARMRIIAREIEAPLANFKREMAEIERHGP